MHSLVEMVLEIAEEGVPKVFDNEVRLTFINTIYILEVYADADRYGPEKSVSTDSFTPDGEKNSSVHVSSERGKVNGLWIAVALRLFT